MKILLYISISVLILSCSSNMNEKFDEQSFDEQSIATVIESEIDNTFDNYFTEPDSNFSQTVTGCSGGYYKVISDQYIIRINSDINVRYGECLEIKVDSNNYEMIAELLIFDKGEASLMNICTDMIISELNGKKTPMPVNRIQKCYGNIFVGKTDPTDYYGNMMPKLTIRIEELKFIDDKSKEIITIKDELLWKVLNTGTPG